MRKLIENMKKLGTSFLKSWIYVVCTLLLVMIFFGFYYFVTLKNEWPIEEVVVSELQKTWAFVRVIEVKQDHSVYDGFGQPINKDKWYIRYKENGQLFPLSNGYILPQTNATSGIIVRSQIIVQANAKSPPFEPVYAEVLCF
jgi:hypothetical protein